jgi:predicted acetyltransferase
MGPVPVTPGLVTLQAATLDMEPVLRHLLELYVEELSAIFPVQRGADGRFAYPKLTLYWSEPDTRYPFIIKAGAATAGFALVTRGSPASDSRDVLDVAEFFVLPAHRRAGVGRHAATALWDHLPGDWIVRVSQANRAGLRFWPEVIASYSSSRFVERTQAGQPHGWRIFTFESRSDQARAFP